MRPVRVTRYLCAALLVMTSSAAAQSSAALADTLARWTRTRGDLAWSAEHPVLWPDFRGPAREKGRTAAETSSGVTYTLVCRNEELRFAVLATFSPAKSWVKRPVPRSRDSDKILRHERTHFNISELFARSFRRQLSEARGICPSRSKESERIFDRLKDRYDDLQEQYDRETNHGTLPKPQAAWNALIAARIDSTARWGAH